MGGPSTDGAAPTDGLRECGSEAGIFGKVGVESLGLSLDKLSDGVGPVLVELVELERDEIEEKMEE